MPVVVDFPFVPETPMYGTSHSRAPNSNSPQIGRLASRAHATTGARGGTPGLTYTIVAPVRSDGSWGPAEAERLLPPGERWYDPPPERG